MKNKKGISLLVSIITIIVIIILAGAIILTLLNGGVLDNSRKATFMSDFRTVQEGVNFYALSKYNATSGEFELPLKGYLNEEDKTYIKDYEPTLNTKITQLSGEVDTANLAWISSEDVGVKLSKPKEEKGYIIDLDNGQIYDYVGDYFEGKRWHTLDGGVVSDGTSGGGPQIVEELWDGWIRLTLYYPSNSTERKWRLGSEGEIRVDPMLMWQNYTGPITIPLDRTKDVWIKYKIDNKEVIIPPAGTLLVDIEPSSTGTKKVESVNVKINYDETATIKEYRVGNSGWITYTDEFTVTENCIVEARAKKTETIYNTDGTVLANRDISGSDMVYIGNVGIEEIPLAAPTITRLPAQSGDEVARVQVTYPANASRKIYTINYGIQEDYTSEISIKSYGMYVIAYYYDASGKKSMSTAIYINDTTKGDPPKVPTPHEPLPPYNPENPPITSKVDLAAPTITRLPAEGAEKARVQVTYPAKADRKIFTQNYGAEQSYKQEIEVTSWGTLVTAYYYDIDGNKSRVSYIRINDTSTGNPPTGPNEYPPITSEIIPAPPVINLNPNSGITTQVTVSVSSPAEADKTYIKIGRYGEYIEYTAPIVVRDNVEIYAYYKTYDGKKSYEANSRIKNIRKNETGTSNVKPYVYIDANPYPWSGSYGASKVTVSISYADADTIEYSDDGIIFKLYTAPFEITENKTIYARGINTYGATETSLKITNIGKLKSPAVTQNLYISINVNPEPSVTVDRVAKATVAIDYDTKAAEKYYRIGTSGEFKEYTGSFEVAKNCTIYAYAKGPYSQGSTSKSIDNLIDGISEPYIVGTPTNKTQTSKVNVGITYDKYATIKRYSIDGGTLRDYTGAFDITKNGSVIYAYSENVKGQKSESRYTITNIVPEPPVLVVDKGNYYILKLNYPEGSEGREYKWKENGTWSAYKEAGIMLIKPQFKDNVIQNGTLIKIEDENGKIVTFTGDYYLIDVPISEMFENIFMRWDRVPLGAPQIIITPTEPAMQVTANIVYNSGLITKQYKVVNPDGSIKTDWTNYTSPITIDRNNSVVYAKGMDESEVWTTETIKKITNIDENPPVITLTADLDTAMQKVAVKVSANDDIAVGQVKWTSGIQGESYFTNLGTEVANNSIVNITSNGYYTFYAEDKVGNKQVYTLNVTNVDLTAPSIDIQVSPETTVVLTANVTINYGDSIIKQYKVGTNNATWTNYTNTFAISSYTVLSNNWQNSDGTVTIYAKGKDSAGNEVTVQKKVLSLDLDKPKAPVINSNSGYPILSEYGMKFDAQTSIVFDTRTDVDNLYSLDNGVTWLTYTGEFQMTSGTIIAKSVKKSTGLEVVVSKTVTIPSDAIGALVYDENYSTYIGSGTKYMKVDSSVQGKNIRVKWSAGFYNGVTARLTLMFLDSNMQTISSISKDKGTYDEIYTIPGGTAWIKYVGQDYIDNYNKFYYYAYLYEIQLCDEPTFSIMNGYMLLTADTTKVIRNSYQMIAIDYFPTSVQRLYRIGTTGVWLNYQDQPIKVNQDQTIYTKGIDQYGNETRIISSYTVNIVDALKKDAFDNSDASYVTDVTNQYIQVDSNMQGKNIRVRWYSYSTSYVMYIRFLDENRQVISSVNRSGGTFDDIYAIPTNTKWIRYEGYTANAYTRLYEIQTSNEPTFSAINGYMLLHADPTRAVKEPYQMVTINYFPTSVQKLYKIGTTSEWNNYQNNAVLVNHGQTIYAKGIDQYGNETRIASSYTSNSPDALTKEVYDGNYSTYIGSGTKYMKVDSGAQGKNIRVKWSAGFYNGVTARLTLMFLDSNMQMISSISRDKGTYDEIYTIPSGTAWIKYVGQDYIDNYNKFYYYAYLYEIQLCDEPTFSIMNGYMLLTADTTKVIRNSYQMIAIDYFPTSVQRLYRIGTTGVWLNYQDQPIKVNQDQTIYTKGIDQYGNETRIISSYTVNIVDALKKDAFDNSDASYVTDVTNQYIQVDSNMQGKNIRVRWYSYSTSYVMYIRFLDENRQVISSVNRSGGTFDDIYAIPTNTKWIRYEGYTANAYTRLYEIQTSNEPTFSAINGYMLLHADPTRAVKEPYQMVTINYFPTSVQKLYKIGTTSEWNNYQNNAVLVNHGQTIYAKGIDQYGNETRIASSYTSNSPDALTKEVYDGNYSTYIGSGTKYMKVDSGVQGKNIRVKWSAGFYNGVTARLTLMFLDSNMQTISSILREKGTYDEIYTIPSGTVWIKYVGQDYIDNYNKFYFYAYLYEIQINN